MYKDLIKNKKLFEIKIPNTIVPKPEDKDYSTGSIKRYFVRKANDLDGHIFEVDKDTYEAYIKNPFWLGSMINWRIAGPLYETLKPNGNTDDRGVLASNKASIGNASNIPNLKLYLPNLQQYHKGI
jgi:hypothetical protein